MRYRTIHLNEEALHVPTGIYRDGPGWRVDIDRRRVAGVRFRRYVPDNGRSPQDALQDAIAVLRECPLTAVRDGRQTPMPRVAQRRLTLTRDVVGSSVRFTLEIPPSKSAWRRPWMRIFLGTDRTLTQERINHAIALLCARWAAFQAHAAAHSIREALDQRYEHCPPATAVKPRLRLCDVRCWTGKGTLISFQPRPKIVSSRRTTFAPELNTRQAIPFTLARPHYRHALFVDADRCVFRRVKFAANPRCRRRHTTPL